ncbi:DgyrCDS1941 [Dimorphilus gyrociliatus]|uniref:DgyrCDS1941 n=1 Tax=Dimorphilus gyrociliatus TaxID=2664684 RepID=A0A7I8V908_9ANNE|nr:DgyrCDS1941 [Dimorphilus gyrociliatus]
MNSANENDKCKIRIIGTDVYEVSFQIKIKGDSLKRSIDHLTYRFIIDDEPKAYTFKTREISLTGIKPNSVNKVKIESFYSEYDTFKISNEVIIKCPKKPPPPVIQTVPIDEASQMTIRWKKPYSMQKVKKKKDICFYRVFMSDKQIGEVDAADISYDNYYKFPIHKSGNEQYSDIYVRSYAGENITTGDSREKVYCISESENSNIIPVTFLNFNEQSPVTSIQEISTKRIVINWSVHKAARDPPTIGFHLIKNNELHGSILPPEQTSFELTECILGETLSLQLIQIFAKNSLNCKQYETYDLVSSIPATPEDFIKFYIRGSPLICRFGKKITFNYTNLNCPIDGVKLVNLTENSAKITWKTKNLDDNKHFIDINNFLVKWWPGEYSKENVKVSNTEDREFMMDNLIQGLQYTVVVESLREELNTQMSDQLVIYSEKSAPLKFQMITLKSPITNLEVVESNSSSIKLQWRNMLDSPVHPMCFRIDATLRNSSEKVSALIVDSDKETALITNLKEKSKYLISFTVVTKEYMENYSEVHSSEILENDEPPPKDVWLPRTNILGMTSGADPPSDIHFIKATLTSIMVSWEPVTIYGSYRHQGSFLKWAEVDQFGDTQSENEDEDYFKMAVESNNAIISNLKPAAYYKVFVESVISVKLDLDDKNSQRDTILQKSKVYSFKMEITCPSPKPFITGFTATSISVGWRKPILFVDIGTGEDGSPRYQKLNLMGYKLRINDRPPVILPPSKQEFKVKECKQGEKTRIVLIALTSTQLEENDKNSVRSSTDSERSLDKEYNSSNFTLSSSVENDCVESFSKELYFIIPQKEIGQLSECGISYLKSDTDDVNNENMELNWDIYGSRENVKKVRVTYGNLAEKEKRETIFLDPLSSVEILPILEQSCIQEVVVTLYSKNNKLKPSSIKFHCATPERLFSPTIFVSNTTSDEFLIEWNEPELWDLESNTYQLYINEEKTKPLLKLDQRMLSINRNQELQRVQLQAISNSEGIENSYLSNILEVLPVATEIFAISVDDVTDTAIDLSWKSYSEGSDFHEYELVWKNEEFDSLITKKTRIRKGEKNCVIHKCHPGTVYYITLYAIDKSDNILSKTVETCIETSAFPEKPKLRISSINLESITVCWDECRTFGRAEIIIYKIYVNSIFEKAVPSDQLYFTYCKVYPLKQYAFQVQAVTAGNYSDSELSDTVVATLPRFKPPFLEDSFPFDRDTFIVCWEPPHIENLEIKYFKLICQDEKMGDVVQVISDLDNFTTKAELKNLGIGIFNIYLEIQTCESKKIFKSGILRIVQGIRPNPPTISLLLVDLKERLACKKLCCDLINERDKLISVINSSHRNLVQTRARGYLINVNFQLLRCLRFLRLSSHSIKVRLRWVKPQDNPEVPVSGYQVVVNGKLYGSILNKTVNHIELQLSPKTLKYKISMVSVCSKKQCISKHSEAIEFLTKPFLPFHYFAFFDNLGSIFEQSLKIEKHMPISRNMQIKFAKWSISLTSLLAVNIFDGNVQNLTSFRGSNYPTALLFWSNLNPYSFEMLKWFAKFAESTKLRASFISILSSKSIISNYAREIVAHKINQTIRRNDNYVHHFASNSSTYNKGCGKDILLSLGVKGVPTVIVIHPKDNIVWKGRYCAQNYEHFETFMSYVLTAEGREDMTNPWKFNNNFASARRSKILSKRSKLKSAKDRTAENEGMTINDGPISTSTRTKFIC